jgi:hypothetical protein
MAAGAARHGARKGARRTTNALQALGVAGGGLLAVTVMTMLAGGPADPDPDETALSVSTGTLGAAEGLARGRAPTGHPVFTVQVRSTTIPTGVTTPWSPTVPPGGVPAPTTVPASTTPTGTTTPTRAPSPTPTPTPTTTPSPTATPTPDPTPTLPQPTPEHTPTPTPTPTHTTGPPPHPPTPPGRTHSRATSSPGR